MLKRFNFVSALALILLPGMAEAATALTTLNDITSALKEGETVNTVMDLSKCTPASVRKSAGTMQGGLRIDSFLIRPDQSLSFADDRFTMTAKDRKPIYQLLRYHVKADKSVVFSMTTMTVPEMKQIGSVETYHCTIGEGMRFFKN